MNWDYLKFVWALRPIIITPIIVLLCLPIIFSVEDSDMPEDARKCLYTLIIMAVLWVTETIPISATALMPVFMFPLSGVLTASVVCSQYINSTIMLFVGGLVVAVAVEEWGLHRRIALAVLQIVGSDPKWLMLGMMIPTWFLSMWISNTATTSMMIPIADAVLQQMMPRNKDTVEMRPVIAYDGEEGKDNQGYQADGDNKDSKTVKPDSVDVTVPQSEQSSTESNVSDARYSRLCKGFSLCIAYASNVGGIATLTGTPPNLVLKEIADTQYDNYRFKNETKTGSGISYANWMGFALPLSAITLILAWLLLMLFYVSGRGCCTQSQEQSKAVKKVVKKEWKDLGRMSLAEFQVLILFILLAILWVSRDPKESPGWSTAFKDKYVADACPAILISILLFILPAKLPVLHPKKDEEYYTPILTWEQVNSKLPWGIIILLGGGYALAKGVTDSGLAEWLGDELRKLDVIQSDSTPTWVSNLVLCLAVAAFTEVTSNTATANILLPVLFSMAIAIEKSPLYFMVSAALSCSFAFMLPVATPPNAIVFSYGKIRVNDMMQIGFFMNLIAVSMLTLAVNTWGSEIFEFGHLDPIFLREIQTTS